MTRLQLELETKRSHQFSARRIVYQKKTSGWRVETWNRPVLSKSGEEERRKPIDQRKVELSGPAMQPTPSFATYFGLSRGEARPQS